jgi:hypothetical protein
LKHLARIVLKLATLGIPVVIAACYGMPYQYSRQGRVIDKSTHLGIGGIRVTCLDEEGAVDSETRSGENGSFVLYYDQICATLMAEDDDGAENGGKYKATSLALGDHTGGDVSILMEQE